MYSFVIHPPPIILNMFGEAGYLGISNLSMITDI